MRKELAKLEEIRTVFTGTFARFSSKSGYKGPVPTVLLQNIRDSENKLMTDHLWFNLTKGFDALDLQGGERIKFHARVKEYVKGYMGRDEEKSFEAPIEIDYKLSHPTKISIIQDK